MPLRAPLISILLGVQVHCLRYGRLAPRSVHYFSTGESGFMRERFANERNSVAAQSGLIIAALGEINKLQGG